MRIKSGIKQIESHGVLLVFPIKNKPEPKSIWSQFYPQEKMIWEWNEDSDDRIGDMWLLMKKLSECRLVIYSKWYQGRATFFSKDLFCALLRLYVDVQSGAKLPRVSQDLLEHLENDSPLSTKQLKKAANLQGRFHEGEYNRGLKKLFLNFLAVGCGEVEDGAFPSLAVGSTRLIYENLWTESTLLSAKAAQKTIDKYMPLGSLTRKYLDKNLTPL